jgi:protease-4
VTSVPHRNLLSQLKAPTTTDDLAVTAAPLTLDGLTTGLYSALGLPPAGVLRMPFNWEIS